MLGAPLTQFTEQDQRDLLELMRFVRYDKHTLLKALTFLRTQAGYHGNPVLSEASGTAQSEAPK